MTFLAMLVFGGSLSAAVYAIAATILHQFRDRDQSRAVPQALAHSRAAV